MAVFPNGRQPVFLFEKMLKKMLKNYLFCVIINLKDFIAVW